MFPGLPMQGILTEQSIQGSCILVRVQDAIECVSQNITNNQLEELGSELQEISRLVREFEDRATEINIQLMQEVQEDNGNITQSELKEVERLMYGDLRVITKEHQSLQRALKDSWQNVRQHAPTIIDHKANSTAVFNVTDASTSVLDLDTKSPKPQATVSSAASPPAIATVRRMEDDSGIVESEDESDKVRPTDESIARGIKKIADNVTEATRTIGKHKEKPESAQHIDKDPPMRPRSADLYSVSNPHQDNAVREIKTLQKKLERSEKACEGLQQG